MGGSPCWRSIEDGWLGNPEPLNPNGISALSKFFFLILDPLDHPKANDSISRSTSISGEWPSCGYLGGLRPYRLSYLTHMQTPCSHLKGLFIIGVWEVQDLAIPKLSAAGFYNPAHRLNLNHCGVALALSSGFRVWGRGIENLPVLQGLGFRAWAQITRRQGYDIEGYVGTFRKTSAHCRT